MAKTEQPITGTVIITISSNIALASFLKECALWLYSVSGTFGLEDHGA